MTRAEFAVKVAIDSKSTLKASKAWTDAVLDSLADAIANEEVLNLRNVGTFEHKTRKAKVGRNYKTGERVEIPPKRVIKFTPCGHINEALSEESIPHEEAE